jgi:uncharacterized protein (TIGR03083 family)
VIGLSMTEAEIREAIAGERRDLAEVLTGLSARSWDTQSLCAGWRVREVVAHVTMPFRYSTPRFVAELVKSGGKFSRMTDRCARRDAQAHSGGLVSALKDNATHPWKPPGGGFEGALTHDVIHGLDVTVPLGIGRHVPEERLRIALRGITKPKPLKYFGVDLTGIELCADDIDWAFGSGTLVTGAAQDLALLLCGRTLPPGLLRGAREHGSPIPEPIMRRLRQNRLQAVE